MRLIASSRPMNPTRNGGVGSRRAAAIAPNDATSTALGMTTSFSAGTPAHRRATAAAEGEGTTTASAAGWITLWTRQCQRGFGWVVWIDWRNRTPGQNADAAVAVAFAWRRKLKTVSKAPRPLPRRIKG